MRCSSAQDAATWADQASAANFHSCFTAENNTAILWRKDFDLFSSEAVIQNRLTDFRSDGETQWSRRTTAVRFSFPDLNILFVCTYASNNAVERRRYFADLFAKLQTNLDSHATPTEVCLLGDWNCVLQPHLDSLSGNGPQRLLPDDTDTSARVLLSLTEKHELTDAWRNIYKLQNQPTNTGGGAWRRLDRFYISKGLPELIVYCRRAVNKMSGSHWPVSLAIKIPGAMPTGSDFWKMPADLLDSPLILRQLSSLIGKTYKEQRNDGATPGQAWDAVVRNVALLAQRHGQRRAGFRKKHGIHDEERERQGKLLRTGLNPEETSDAALRERLRRYFARSSVPCLLRDPTEADNLPDAVLSRDREESNTTEMLQITRTFFAQAFASEATDEAEQHSLLEYVEARLKKSQHDRLEAEYTIEELTDSMEKVKSNSSPGPNGLPMRFFKLLWQDIGPILLEIKNESAVSGQVSKAQRLRNIVLLPKEGDARLLTQKRPISLIDCDTRILSRVDADRMIPVIGKLIHPDQTGFMPRRWIGDTIEASQMLFDEEREGWAAYIDWLKAYDRVEHSWIDLVLQKFGFGPRMRNVVRSQYAGGQASVVLNGFLTPRFDLERGVPQGSAMSCFIFNLCLEPLACKLRHEDDGLKGILIDPAPLPPRPRPPTPPPPPLDFSRLAFYPRSPPPPPPRPRGEDHDDNLVRFDAHERRPPRIMAVPQPRPVPPAPPPSPEPEPERVPPEPFKGSFIVRLFADDTTIGCRDLNEVDKLQTILQTYGYASGARLNLKKSFLAPMRRTASAILAQAPVITEHSGWRIELNSFRYLGVECGRFVDREVVWEKLTTKMKKRINGLLISDLPLFIQARCLNRYVVSMAIFAINFCPPRQKHLDVIQSAIEDKIYPRTIDGKAGNRKAFKALYTPLDMGGLGLINLTTHVLPSLAHWIGRLAEDTDKLHILNVRAVLNLREIQPPDGPGPKLQWPMAIKRQFITGANLCRSLTDPLPWRWMQFRAAFNSIAKFKSADSSLTPQLIADLCDEKYEDVRVPFDIHSAFDVDMPKQIEAQGIFSKSFQNRIAHDVSTVVIPSWADKHFPDAGQRPPRNKEWKALWKRIATLPLTFAHFQQSWYFIAYRAHHPGTKAWTLRQDQPNNTALCTLCGNVEETFQHLLIECLVSLQIWHSCIDAQSSPPPLADIVCPKVRWNKFTKEDLKVVLFVGTVSRLARSRRARKEVVSMPAAEDELQPYLVKLKSFMRLGLSIVHSRERAQAAKVAAQVAADARAEAALAADADADAEAEASAQADADADANG